MLVALVREVQRYFCRVLFSAGMLTFPALLNAYQFLRSLSTSALERFFGK